MGPSTYDVYIDIRVKTTVTVDIPYENHELFTRRNAENRAIALLDTDVVRGLDSGGFRIVRIETEGKKVTDPVAENLTGDG
jgi:hypothetical protein